MSLSFSPSLALSSIRIVLCTTTHPGNIGAAARAMKTMGISDLALVTPRFFPHEEANTRATSAVDILERAQVFNSLAEALKGCHYVVGLTSRRRDLSHDMVSLREAAVRAAREVIRPISASQEAPTLPKSAFVFGTEMSGLSNSELDLCNLLANIPTDPDFASLNLGSAVQVSCYELRQAFLGDTPVQPFPQPMAVHEDVEALFDHLERTLLLTQFLNPKNPKKLMERLRRLLTRSRLEQEEVSMLRGLLKSFERTVAPSSKQADN
jgi:tRNA/rRNA methyltransferase